ncbi:MAG: hypothetical protein LBB05_03510 [Puniceicoccales bacterium]|jgi:hypothetical protein|nr:hypothetical protein [Puniceicoccales bacterium]
MPFLHRRNRNGETDPLAFPYLLSPIRPYSSAIIAKVNVKRRVAFIFYLQRNHFFVLLGLGKDFFQKILDIMKAYTLLLAEVCGGFFSINIGGSEVTSWPSASEKQLRIDNTFIFAHIEGSCGLKPDEFLQLPFVFQRRITSLSESCNLRMLKKIKGILQEFLGMMPPYRHYAVERIFFDAISFIIRHSDIRYNGNICRLLDTIGDEFRDVEEFIVPRARYPFFSGVMPWHDGPLGECIDREDCDGLKEVLGRCLASDFIHNVSSGDTVGLFEIYRQAAQTKGVWDDEIDQMFRELGEKYSLEQYDSPLGQDWEFRLY